MDLKELLGEELYSQVMEKAGDNKLAIVSDGNWIPKAKFDDKIQEVKDLETELENRDTQLEDLKKVDADALQKTIDDLQEANKTQKTEYEEKLQKQAFDHALNNALTGAKVRNPKAAKALLELETIKLDGDKLLGLDSQLEALKESDGYLFQSEQGGNDPQIVTTGNPNGGSNITKNPFSKEHWNLTEQGKLLNENPELYEQMKAQAGK